ncbi:MAG TPA: carboxypeptidase regulatory-like domain-containing protein, partial [Pyrinomonadaceae bacterium]
APQETRPREGGGTETTPARTQTLPIRRVILYSNGVAHVERRGTVTGRAEIALSFKQSQVDDVLKSMVVLDLGQGRIGAVSYNSSAPPAARMADIPFSVPSQSGGGGLAAILAQLQGARVVVTTRAGAISTGSILTVERRDVRPDPEKPATTTAHALVITSETGELMSFDLDDVRSVKLADEGTRRDVNEFARATASARRRDAKTIVVTSDGSGAREMLVSYTIAAPIWKTTYRTVFDSSGKPFFQGWAIVDNVSEEDWIDVRLSLISGTPISFILPVQQPFYRYRPVVPMPADLKLHPQTHDPLLAGSYGTPGTVGGVVTDPQGAAIAGASVVIRNNSTGQTASAQTSYAGEFQTGQLPPGNYTVVVTAPGFSQTTVTNVSVSAAAPTNIGVNLQAGATSENFTTDGVSAQRSIAARQLNRVPVAGRRANSLADLRAGAPPPPPDASAAGRGAGSVSVSDAITGGQSGVEAAVEGGEVGDLFEYQIQQPVTVRRDRSALIPIVQTHMEGSRVSIFNESVRRDRPMSGLLLKNTTNLTLEDGAMTVIDGNAYAGEALMERLKPQEQRLVSFALDLGTLVGVQQKADRAPASIVRIKDGVFQVHYFQEDKKIYTVTNQTDRPRVLYVEHPVRQGWELSKETRAPEGRSQRYYRFRVELKPNERAELPVTERRALMESYALSDFTRPQLDLFFSRRYIDEQTRAALQNLIDLRARIGRLDERDAAIDAEIEEIGEDQKRLRENIQALNSTAEARTLITRYVQKADQQETRIEQLTKEKQSLAQERERLRSQLDAAVRALVLDRNLTE